MPILEIPKDNLKHVQSKLFVDLISIIFRVTMQDKPFCQSFRNTSICRKRVIS